MPEDIKLGQSITFTKEGKEYKGVVTYCGLDYYVVIYSPDERRIEFETITTN